MTWYELLVLVFLFAISDYNVTYNFKHYNSEAFSPAYYYALHGKYRSAYSDYDVADNLSLWTCNFIEWLSDEQFFHEFFYYAMFGKYRPFLFFNI